MGKKKPKNRDSSSYSLNTSTKDSFIAKNNSSDICVGDSFNMSHFKVILSHNSDEKDNYYKWMKNCSWKNVAFVNSSVLSTLQCGAHIIIQGKQFSSVFIARPLKTVKKSAVVILGGMGFEHEESVSIYPFSGEGYEATEIFLTSSSEFEDSENLKSLLKRKLCNQFIWPNLKIELIILKTKYKFEITKVKYLNRVLLRNFSRIYDSLEDSSYCGNSFLSDSRKKDMDNDSEIQLSTIFSALTLQDSVNISNTASGPQSTLHKFFTLSYHTVVTFCNEQINLKASKLPLFEHIGGYKEQVLLVKNYVKEFLEETNDKANHKFLLLKGPPGTGKSMILNAACNESYIYVEKIYKNSLVCKEVSEACKEITQKFNNLTQRSKSILLLDDFDILCPSKLNHSNSQVVVITLLRNLILKQHNLLVLTATSSDIDYDENFMKHCCIQEIRLPLPTTLEREEIVEKILNDLKHNLSQEQIKLCAEISQGMSGGEIFKILKYDGSMLSLIRIKNTSSTNIELKDAFLNFIDVMTAFKKKKQHIMSPNFESKKVRWSDIGGMEEIKEKLKEEMELAQMSPENIKRFNYSPSRGILFYGPPGCCKTMIARALATECNWNFISKKASDILNMYVGESEKAVTNLFLEARVRSPCIVFLDEIDALAPSRSSCANASGVGNRIVNSLLTEMAGIETLKDVMIIAATNRPNIIDSAVLRRGRIGQHIYIPLPDIATRKEIFLLSMKRRCVSDEVDFNNLVEKTEGYTGAEIVHLCNEAAMQLLTDDPECSSPVFKMEHFKRALSAVPPRTSKETIQFYERFSLQS